jgi:hypothetical protein
MQPKPTLSRFAVLLALPLALSLSACGGGERPEFIKPAKHRVERVPAPEIPEGRVPCAHDPAQRCLDDEQNATLLSGFADALDQANARLLWLAIFLGLE